MFGLAFFCICLCPAKIKIILSKTEEKVQERSVIIEPTAYYEANTIYLQSDILIEELQVTIKDKEGNVISSEIIFLSPEQSYDFSLGDIENGIYLLELNDGENGYYGYFEICE